MLFTVHDELVFESPPDLAEKVGAALQEEMRGALDGRVEFSVPLEVDIGIAENWNDA